MLGLEPRRLLTLPTSYSLQHIRGWLPQSFRGGCNWTAEQKRRLPCLLPQSGSDLPAAFCDICTATDVRRDVHANPPFLPNWYQRKGMHKSTLCIPTPLCIFPLHVGSFLLKGVSRAKVVYTCSIVLFLRVAYYFLLQVEDEGEVATAATMARVLSSIPPSRGGPTSLVIYDIHALQVPTNIIVLIC